MNNHCVPDFELDDDYPIPTSSSLAPTMKSSMAGEEIEELLWQNGHVVVQSQNQRPLKRSNIGDSAIPAEQLPAEAREVRLEEESTNHLFIQEDEMTSWLHYPIDDLYADLLYPAPSALVATPSCSTPISEVRLASTAARPPIPPARFQNFMHFTRPKGRIESGPFDSNKVTVTSTVVDSSETPAMGPKSRVSHLAVADSAVQVQVGGANVRCDTMGGAPAGELTVTSSPSGSEASASESAEPVHKPKPKPKPIEDRKRKGKEADEFECHSEDVEFESPDAKKQVRGSMKKSRAAEVHNLSERRRRDRINEKMKALQELIPRCNKSDKASMLDEAIEYLKSLQLQVQMMSMGCGMVPMMFPGVQHYMPPMGMGIGMGMNRPMMPFPSVLAVAGSALPTPTSAAAAHMGPRFPLPAFHIALPDPSRMQPPSQSEPMLNSHSLGAQNLNHSRIPNFPHPYQQYLSLQQMQVPLSQSQAMVQPSTSKPSSSSGVENFENHQSG